MTYPDGATCRSVGDLADFIDAVVGGAAVSGRVGSAASLKDDANGGVGDSARRRLRGTAAQTFLALLGVAATNSRRIHAWMAEHYDETEPAPAATERRKRTPRLAPAAPRRRSRKGVPASRTARYQTSGAPPGVPALV
ncbi:hypothetical protein DEU34_0650 [Microbacterium sp. AG1240]|uniref:hypothetical protein n=1 Tax=Microbacterium sp. AG1240 TaxID=2183992 RepID=UPI000EB3CBAF|nr:hypothetical protein [Microbacterium sp. AG1240]RKT36142.1 hypothetical protein DEU34_0650 [Microbacterium sp. AG1240]